MKLIASNICKKPSLDKAQDLIGKSGNFYWLLDGATPPYGSNELTYDYIQALNRGLEKQVDDSLNPDELLYRAIKQVQNEFKHKKIEAGYIPSSTIIIVKIEESIVKYLVIGDSSLCISIENRSLVVSDTRLKFVAMKEREELQNIISKGISEDSEEYIKARKNLIGVEMKHRNKDGGYWIAELNPDVVAKAKTGSVSFEKDEHVEILAISDGLERLISTFGVYSSMYELAQAILIEGDEHIFKKLRDLESSPKLFRNNNISQYDDASYFLLVKL